LSIADDLFIYSMKVTLSFLWTLVIWFCMDFKHV